MGRPKVLGHDSLDLWAFFLSVVTLITLILIPAGCDVAMYRFDVVVYRGYVFNGVGVGVISTVVEYVVAEALNSFV